MNCAICGIRKPRRHCPGVHGDICSVCCGTEREQSIDCPLDCAFLQEAHQHEKPSDFDPDALPNSDIKVTEEFMRENTVLTAFIGKAVYDGALAASAQTATLFINKTPAVVGGSNISCTDYDAREGLESLVNMYRARNAGLYYESVPLNTFAAGIVKSVQTGLDDLREREMEETGSPSIRDGTVLGVLAFVQRLEYTHNNGRKRSRAFIDLLRTLTVEMEDAYEESLEPEAPRIIL